MRVGSKFHLPLATGIQSHRFPTPHPQPLSRKGRGENRFSAPAFPSTSETPTPSRAGEVCPCWPGRLALPVADIACQWDSPLADVAYQWHTRKTVDIGLMMLRLDELGHRRFGVAVTLAARFADVFQPLQDVEEDGRQEDAE